MGGGKEMGGGRRDGKSEMGGGRTEGEARETVGKPRGQHSTQSNKFNRRFISTKHSL